MAFFRAGEYKGYMPLWSDEPGAVWRFETRRKAVIAALLAAVLLASSICNIVFIHKLKRGWPTALDNYQHLNIQPIIDEEYVHSLGPLNPNENAIVTTLYTDAYATAIATLGESLNMVNTTASRILFYFPEKVSPHALCIATSSGFTPHPVTRIPPPPGSHVNWHFVDQYTKLTIWTLGDLGVRGAVYLDADTLVLRNFDELFRLPHNFAAVPDVFPDNPGFSLNINAGVLFVRPSREVFDDMVTKIGKARYDTTDAEQGFLNHYYGAEVVRLPYAYNANLAIKLRKPELWEDLWGDARIVHYTIVKPFLAEWDNRGKKVVDIDDITSNAHMRMKERDGVFEYELREWLRIWRETRRKHGEAIAQCRNTGAAPDMH
ncbi:glycosyltransferase family 8 protein [Wolfiporia cocos MD-104 SS10]|uniref:Glycosyltransferase family 8 protein n=1 Tax=Wolfiporia cocos (strain MD-104) TaxID=742152 RepID=A0A2H3J038_WOLCO|nr:glycosyltransferase family 8 protein [Wolfiporia cocos MD-104 SS10]